MRLSHQRQFVFLSNPKCASTTVRELLEPYSDITSSKTYSRAIGKNVLSFQNIVSGDRRRRTLQMVKRYVTEPFPARNPLQNHVDASTLKQYFDKLGWDWDAYYSFTTIRNPWDRFVSMYEYGLRNERSVWHQYARGASFSAFVGNREVAALARRYSHDSFALGEDGEQLLDCIIRIEDLGTELPKVLTQLNIEGLERIPVVNTTNRGHYRTYYDESSAEIVGDLFASDIRVGEYSF